MTDRIETLLKQKAEQVDVPPDDLHEVVAGGKRRVRLLWGGVIVAMVTAAGLGWGVWAGQDASDVPPAREVDEQGRLPDHIVRLRGMLPEDLEYLATRELVLLFEYRGKYHAFYEGILRHSCPVNALPRVCFATAVEHIAVAGSARASRTGSDLLELKVPDGARVLYRGEPATGYIGVKAENACDREEKFEPEFSCIDGTMVYRR